MLRIMCVVLVAVGLCLGTVGCSGDKKTETPKDVPPPATKPTGQSQTITAPE